MCSRLEDEQGLVKEPVLVSADAKDVLSRPIYRSENQSKLKVKKLCFCCSGEEGEEERGSGV